MFRPTNSRLQSDELESMSKKPDNDTIIHQNGKLDYWNIFQKQKTDKSVLDKEKGELEEETSLLKTRERYGGFLSALDSTREMKPKVQSKSLSIGESSSVRGGLNPNMTERQRDANDQSYSGKPDSREPKHACLQNYAFDKSKFDHINMIADKSRLCADLDFRHQLMKGTRFT